MGKTRHSKETFWALRDISFNVEKGEVVGIIGRNGAGKSTLLKVLSQISYPTSGEVVMWGRVGSLLEVGTGFHADLTGRENVYLNGAILGMRKKEIDAKFDDIVKFAEIEKFLDTPVKRYSSGMHLRLAFAVAAHLEPDILIADEVLAVGDQQFQNKCLGKMKAVSQEGRTVIFVSHDMHAIRALCNSGVLLKAGKVAAMGPLESVIEQYASSMEVLDNEYPVKGDGIIINGLDVRQRQVSTGLIDGSLPFEIVVNFELPLAMQKMKLGVSINTALGDELIRTNLSDWEVLNENLDAGKFEAIVQFPERQLVAGNYSIVLSAKKANGIEPLAGHVIERQIGVSNPKGFDINGANDRSRARVILNRVWEIRRL
ncbi:MAG: ABC transporter ATP-binding protein [Methanomassiliicoccales archaeon]